MEILTGVIIIVVAGGIAFASRASWGAHMGRNLGKKYMEEFGINDDQMKYNQKSGEGEKRE